jgi:hypothetical protein
VYGVARTASRGDSSGDALGGDSCVTVRGVATLAGVRGESPGE